MRVHRQALLVAAGLAVVAAAPVTSQSGAVPGVGTATAASVLASVTAAGSTIEVGTTELFATTDPVVRPAGPLATSGVRLLEIGTAELGRHEATSEDTGVLSGLAIDETTEVGPVGADLDQLSAEADDVSASAALQQLDVRVDLLEGLGLDLAVSSIAASVDGDAADATHSIAVGDIDLTLGAVLGDVLGALPLTDLVALLQQLDGVGDVTAPVDATAADDLVAAVAAATAATLAVEDAADALALATAALLTADASDPLVGYGDTDALGADLAILGGLDVVGDPVGAVAAVVALLLEPDVVALGCGVVPPTVGDVAAAVTALTACITDHLAAHAAAVAALADEAAAVDAAAVAYAARVADAVAATAAVPTSSTRLATLLDTVDTSLADLDTAPLLQLEAFVVEQEVHADAGSPSASHATTSCTGTRLTVAALPPADVVDCDTSTAAVLDAVEALPTVLVDALDTIGLVDTATEAGLSLLSTLEQDVDTSEDGRVTATSVAEVLRLTVPDVTVDLCTLAGPACAIGVDVSAPLDTASLDLPDELTDAHTVVTGALATVTDLLDATGLAPDVTGEATAAATVGASLAAATGVVDTLDLGVLGTAGGTLVRGVDVIVDPVVVATHAPGPDAAPPAPPEPDPDVDPDSIDDPAPEPAADDPDDPAPGTVADPDPTSPADPDEATDPAPDPQGSLPNTGGGAALLAIAAVGAGLALRRRDRVPSAGSATRRGPDGPRVEWW